MKNPRFDKILNVFLGTLLVGTYPEFYRRTKLIIIPVIEFFYYLHQFCIISEAIYG